MPNVQHSSLTGTDLHEPKGVAAATNNSVYVANGSGSGSWQRRQHILLTYLEDVSAVETIYVPIPYAGNIIKVQTILEASIGSADSTVTIRNSSGSTMGTITVAYSGSAAGDMTYVEPSSDNTTTDNDYITVSSDGASTNSAKLRVAIVLERT